jgi:hypothetical protein
MMKAMHKNKSAAIYRSLDFNVDFKIEAKRCAARLQGGRHESDE